MTPRFGIILAESAKEGPLDAKDRQIIRELQQNGRLTNEELAKRVNLSPSPCLRRVRALEKSGVITGYTALVDQKAYGVPITVFIRITLEKHGEEIVQAFENAVRETDEILDCFVMTGNADYQLRVVVGSLEEYEVFIRTKLQPLPWLGSIDTSFAYGRVKQTYVFP
jgi:DNA-binding Lrp family transcriptional regulator